MRLLPGRRDVRLDGRWIDSRANVRDSISGSMLLLRGRQPGIVDEHAEKVEPPKGGIRKELVWVAVTVIVVAALIWWLTSQ